MSARRILFIAGILAVFGIAGWLRLAGLGDRPLHFDESTNARMLGTSLESGATTFDPEHFHGPLLSYAAAPLVRLRGESSWNELTKGNLRLTAALFSLLTVAGALGIARLGGRVEGLAAAAFVATSPLLAYYGRMFIHEPVFTGLGALTLLAILGFLVRPGPWAAAAVGLGAGLMAATRETFVIGLFAWGLAALAWPWPRTPGEPWTARLTCIWKSHGRYLLMPLVLGLVLIGVCYSDFGRHPRGIADFVRTYFTYSVVPGHEKPALYYLELLLWPRLRGGLWWTEVGVLLLALHGYVRLPPGPLRAACRFMVHAGAVYLAVFSLLAYKTPWLPCLGWVHLCLAAGIGAGHWMQDDKGAWRWLGIGVVVLLLAWQTVQCRNAVFRFAVDERNPYAYVPTTRDAERMADWLHTLAGQDPRLSSEPVAVVGGPYWPLPWYLRGFDQVGYWPELPEDASSRPLLLLVTSGEGPDTTALENTHEFFPRGLRHEVLVTVAIRNDIWESTTP